MISTLFHRIKSNHIKIVVCLINFRLIKIAYLVLALYLYKSSLYIAFFLFFCRSRSLFVTNAAKHIPRKAHWRDMLMMCTCELKTTSVQFADRSLHNDRLCYNMSRCIKKHRKVDVQHVSVHQLRFWLKTQGMCKRNYTACVYALMLSTKIFIVSEPLFRNMRWKKPGPGS